MPPQSAKRQPIEVFYSYSHNDEEYREELEKHLTILKRQGVLQFWHYRRIGPGSEWDKEIHSHLETASIILLLVSSDFLASDYCYEVELFRAMARHASGEARAIPIILRPSDWAYAPFGKLQALPRDGKPVSTWANRDEAFTNITVGIRQVAEELRQEQREPAAWILRKSASDSINPSILSRDPTVSLAAEDQAGAPEGGESPPAPDEAWYWSVLRQVMNYGLDVAGDYSVLADGNVLSLIDEETFLRDLYIPRDGGNYERRLAEHLISSVPMLAVVGAAGSGKTSAIRAAGRIILQGPHGSQVAIIIVDFKRLYDRAQLFNANPETVHETFRHLTEERVRTHLFPSTSSMRAYLAWLLTAAPDKADVSDLADLATRAQILAGDPPDLTMTPFTWLNNWFMQHPTQFVDLFNSALPRLRLAHSVQASRSLNSLQRVVLIYDNVDRIPRSYQAALIAVAADNQAANGGAATTCIAISVENIYAGESALSGDRYKLTLPNERQVPSVIAPLVSSRHFFTVVQRRQAVAHRIVQRSAIDSHLRRAADGVNEINSQIVAALHDIPLHDIANGSIRTGVALYVGFLEYAFQVARRGRVTLGDAIASGTLQTLFYLWLGEAGAMYGLRLYDALRIDRDPAAGTFAETASEYHFVLAAVVNLTKEIEWQLGALGSVRVLDVIEWVTELGFGREEAIRALMEMCRPADDRARTLEAIDGELNLFLGDSSVSGRIRLTSLGAYLSREAVSKVGYVWALAYRQRGRDLWGTGSYFELRPEERLDVLLDYFVELERAYLRLLDLLGQTWRARFGSGWLDRFRKRFGVRGKLQLEWTLDGAASFFDHWFYARRKANPFYLLRHDFDELLALIASGLPYMDQYEERLAVLRKAIARPGVK